MSLTCTFFDSHAKRNIIGSVSCCKSSAGHFRLNLKQHGKIVLDDSVADVLIGSITPTRKSKLQEATTKWRGGCIAVVLLSNRPPDKEDGGDAA